MRLRYDEIGEDTGLRPREPVTRALLDDYEKIYRCGWLPAKIAKLIPTVEALSQRLPTITLRELAAELDRITQTLKSFRSLSFDLADLNLSVDEEDESEARAPALPGRGLGWRAAA